MSQVDIEEIHKTAVRQGSNTYIDPATGFTVFTELSHLTRGTCCGNKCRHCPYGWSSVQNGDRRKPKLVSGDKDAAQRLIHASTEPNDLQEPTAGNSENKNNNKHDPAKETTQKSKGGRMGGKYTSKNVPYTRGGDQGTSQLFTGERRQKTDPTFEALGTVDELCTVVGVVHSELSDTQNDYGELSEWLLDVMSRLFDLGTHVATPRNSTDSKFHADGVGGGFDPQHIQSLEDWIDIMTDDLPELNSFILPTGAKAAAQLHVARTVCRRAERRVVELVTAEVCDPNAMRYLNRLSDFFFTAARWVNDRDGKTEIQYRKPYKDATQRNRQTFSLKKVTNDDEST